ncbi:ATP-binding protein [Solilutibacter silvestris]|uniref:histidine kinase n=1 Tax=Solilutibacter silvestris TaxID=1645665 RepID=A0A2K1PXW7_9GAMM|nr:ATP-binding protein [Lysobacter silvestris]PNS07621.1 Histidine kinase-, DNA gyrase B-, and HSP90-like ATPase [Lysobacter silvestris]
MIRLRALDTLSRRIFVILLLGITIAAIAGGEWAEHRQTESLHHIQAERAVERASALLTGLQGVVPKRRQHEAKESSAFLRSANAADGSGMRDAELTALMQPRLLPGMQASVARLPTERCLIPGDGESQVGVSESAFEEARDSKAAVEAGACLRMDAKFADGSALDFITGPPPLLKPAQGMDLGFLTVLGVATALLALLVAQIAVAPVRTLTRAAAGFGPGDEASPLRERGSSDVRTAIRAFNGMQRRLARHSAEQTHMIAAITHDLQTPMTRMRLKLEAIDDDGIRSRLLSDWQAMRAIVEEGLELARSTHLREEAVLLDVDSLIESIVEDETEAGHQVTFQTAAGRDLRCRPQMLRRCVQNLVDNAIHYGGKADMATRVDAQGFSIEIRDAGPGIPEDKLEAVFEPMARLETSRSRETGGTGLGLTIARILAARNNATLALANLPEGGLLATILFANPAYD